MSSKTVIGGTTYEVVGSSTSNLLLKCNGTARIQWGGKLIDLIKNGKIATENSSEQIFKVSDKSEMTKDGIYILANDDSSQLWVCKNGETYNFEGTDLYISAGTKQDITVEQRKQALENLGFYYNTLQEAETAGIQNGIVYILDTKQLYTVKDGKYEEFQAKLETVTVEKETEEGEVISSSVKVVLSVLDKEYLVLADQRIVANYPICVKDHVQIGSEFASDLVGYRLYFKNGLSCLDVDTINVRQGIQTKDYLDITFEELDSLISKNSLQSQQWYLITNFQNHWKLPAKKEEFNRPIMVRASSVNSLYKEGYLFNNKSVIINYDPSYKESLFIDDSESVTARGRITWMKDWNNNEANFDFLDYSDAFGNALATLHQESSYLDKSIFPVGSYNNKIETTNLRGTVVNSEGVLDNTDTFILDFRVTSGFEMHDNSLSCKKLVVESSCSKLVNNTFGCLEDLTISTNISNSVFKDVKECTFLNSFDSVKFKNISNCHFGEGVLYDIICHSDLTGLDITSSTESVLYDTFKFKEICFKNGKIHHIGGDTQVLPRGMIVMHSGLEEIPYGWAICDGEVHEYNGTSTQTPNLVDRFIKAVSNTSDVGPVDNSDLDTNNNLTLQTKHLPEHTHPHTEHTHNLSDISVEISDSGVLDLALPNNNYAYGIETESTPILSDDTLEVESINVITNVTHETQGGNVSGGDHTHTATVSGGVMSSATSVEEAKTWENASIKIEPHYYSLIFIMKL